MPPTLAPAHTGTQQNKTSVTTIYLDQLGPTIYLDQLGPTIYLDQLGCTDIHHLLSGVPANHLLAVSDPQPPTLQNP